MESGRPLADLLARMESILAPLQASSDPRSYFLATYRRTTQAVEDAVVGGRFQDPDWVTRWDEAFAGLYLDAVDRWTADGTAPGPWAVAFAAEAGERVPPVRHVLLGINAHVNYDLPQALLAVIGDEEFDDPGVIAARRADHENIDTILSARVAAEDRELKKVEQPGDRTLLDRLLVPFNRRASRRFLAEARAKVWANAVLLSRARRDGTLPARIAELEDLASRRVADLRAPGQVILRLARTGFGVSLQP